MPSRLRIPLTHLRAWREFRVLSQAELAEKAGVSRSTVLLIEKGESSVNPATVGRLAAALGVSRETLAHKAPPQE